jgi:hypothetical protein
LVNALGQLFGIWFGSYLLSLLVLVILAVLLMAVMREIWGLELDTGRLHLQFVAFVMSLILTSLFYAFT